MDRNDSKERGRITDPGKRKENGWRAIFQWTRADGTQWAGRRQALAETVPTHSHRTGGGSRVHTHCYRVDMEGNEAGDDSVI